MNADPVIGLEIHAQLLTKSKIFCGCSTSPAEPNAHTCPVCLGYPGTLPVLNGAAVEFAMRAGLALGCSVRSSAGFDRKHYFYPDLPKGYQITQQRQPLCADGAFDIETEDGAPRRIRIQRVHLEEDAARLQHEEDATLVDFNRCGIPLIEIVTAPDFTTPEEAARFVRRLRQLLMYCGICDGSMEEGSLRCDANVSLRLPDGAPGARTEMKNLNSVKSVQQSLAWEIARQHSLLDRGETVESVTLLWDESRQEARVMRGKETAAEYHYMPEPDLPPVRVTDARIAAARASLPEMPLQRRRRFVEDLGLPAYDADVLTADKPVADYYESVLAEASGADAKQASNFIMTEVLRDYAPGGAVVSSVSPPRLAILLQLVRAGAVSITAAKEVFAAMRSSTEDAAAIIERLGLRTLHDDAVLSEFVGAVLDAHPAQVCSYLEGKESLLGFFTGQVMKRSGGAADPSTVQRLLREALRKREESA